MAFLHCHTCGWSQDDFWTSNYNPLRSSDIERLKTILFFHEKFRRCNFASLQREHPEIPIHEDEEGKYVLTTDLVAHELRMMAKVIEGMAVKTSKEWKKVCETFVCPKCGSNVLDVD